jgi:hypothetical protein
MKKIGLLLLVTIFVINLQAQVNPWAGFGKPINNRVSKVLNLESGALRASASDSTVKLFSLNAVITGTFFPISHGIVGTGQPLNSEGIALGYGSYYQVNGTTFTNYIVELALLQKSNIIQSIVSNQPLTTGSGFLVAGGRTLFLNTVFTVGGGYLGNNGFANGSWGAFWGINVSF